MMVAAHFYPVKRYLDSMLEWVDGLGMWGPVIMGVLSDSFGGGSAGLSQAGMIICLAGFLASVCYFIGSKFYPEDSEKVRDEVMAEK